MTDNLARDNLFGDDYQDTGPSEVDVMRQQLSKDELLDLYERSVYRDVRVKAGLALNYGFAHKISHPVETFRSVIHR
tara:strand:- start:118 stop:348 length:231 start_codon:yes stop_codon:yes gene_type:complete